jgi:galactose mutarotase-like enzyme
MSRFDVTTGSKSTAAKLKVSSMDTQTIRSAALSATIAAQGAELVSLKDAAGAELLWQAGPEWPRHAPVLFPIVGRLAGDTLRHNGASYRLTQHGFARDSLFECIEHADDRIVLRLRDNEKTRAAYPFAFQLDLIYRLDADGLSVTSRVTNPGTEALPFCIGAHPAFRWPLTEGVAKDHYALTFEADEASTVRTIVDGLLGPPAPSPLDGRALALRNDLFAHDALVFPAVASRAVRFAALDAHAAPRALRVSWRGYTDLGLWSRPAGAPFLCIEPWRGMASPKGWDGPFVEKPGIVLLPPGEAIDFEWRVAVD